MTSRRPEIFSNSTWLAFPGTGQDRKRQPEWHIVPKLIREANELTDDYTIPIYSLANGEGVAEVIQANLTSGCEFRVPAKFAGPEVESILFSLSPTFSGAPHINDVTEKEALKTLRLDRMLRKRVLRDRPNVCCLTGVSVVEALDVAHIIPWRCASPQARQDVQNCLLMTATLHRLFDYGFINISPSGEVKQSNRMSGHHFEMIGARIDVRSRKMAKYLTERAALGNHS